VRLGWTPTHLCAARWAWRDPPGAAEAWSVRPSLIMPVVPLTFGAIRLILDRDAALRASSAGEVIGPSDSSTAQQSGMLPSSVVVALEAALRGRWIGVDSYQVTLTAEDAATLVGWCRDAASSSSPRDGAVLGVAATVIEAALLAPPATPPLT
jgi:hypothetical protein